MNTAEATIETELNPALSGDEQTIIPYQGVPSFADWREARVDVERWNQALASLNELGDVVPDLLRRMRVIIKTAANSITGQKRSRKSRLTEAAQSAMWLAAINEKGIEAQPALESQLLACDDVIEAAVKNRQLSPDWIRQLHARICRTQKTYKIATASGVKAETLRLGEYKHLLNHVAPHLNRRPSYAPVELTQSEMQKLCEELNSSLFLAAHPVLQASYALYSLLIIHPFADGNGRVARSLALLFTYRSNSIQMLALAPDRDAYVSSLVPAAMRDFQPLVDFVQERAIEAMSLMKERICVAMS